MKTKPCKADIELRAVGDKVFCYNNISRDAEEWTIKDREVVYRNDKLVDVTYTLAKHIPPDGKEETLSRMKESDLYDTAKDAVLPHFDDMRQIIEADAVEIKYATDTLLKWTAKYLN